MTHTTQITEEHIDNLLAETYLDLLDNLYDMLVEVNGDTAMRTSVLRRIRWLEAQVPVMLDSEVAHTQTMPELTREVGGDESSYHMQLMLQAQQQSQQ
jgi:hypothetical protein